MDDTGVEPLHHDVVQVRLFLDLRAQGKGLEHAQVAVVAQSERNVGLRQRRDGADLARERVQRRRELPELF